MESDRTQPIQIHAESGKKSSGTAVLVGNVIITQGSLEAHANKGTAYSANGKVVRMVLLGTPATFTQALDNGGNVRASADTIEYKVGADTIVLTGHAHVEQAGQGEFRGARLVYNTGTGAISGQGGESGPVELILQPRTSAPVTTEPAANTGDQP